MTKRERKAACKKHQGLLIAIGVCQMCAKATDNLSLMHWRVCQTCLLEGQRHAVELLAKKK